MRKQCAIQNPGSAAAGEYGRRRRKCRLLPEERHAEGRIHVDLVANEAYVSAVAQQLFGGDRDRPQGKLATCSSVTKVDPRDKKAHASGNVPIQMRVSQLAIDACHPGAAEADGEADDLPIPHMERHADVRAGLAQTLLQSSVTGHFNSRTVRKNSIQLQGFGERPPGIPPHLAAATRSRSRLHQSGKAVARFLSARR